MIEELYDFKTALSLINCNVTLWRGRLITVAQSLVYGHLLAVAHSCAGLQAHERSCSVRSVRTGTDGKGADLNMPKYDIYIMPNFTR